MYHLSKQRLLAGLALAVTQVSLAFQAHAYVPDFSWATGSGGDSFDYAKAVAIDDAGNTFIVGSFQSSIASFGSVTLNNADLFGSPDIFVAKLNPEGVVLWAKKAGSSSDDVATSVNVDASGNAYVTGYFTGIADFGGINLTNTAIGGNVFIAKYDPAGNVVWAKSAASPTDASGNSISVTPDGTSYVSGYFYDALTFGTSSLVGSESKDIFVARCDSSGNVVWLKSAGGTADDEARGIAVDGNGNCYVTGYYISTTAHFDTATLTNNIDSAEVFVAKYTSSGDVSWARQSKGNIYEVGNAIAVDAAGNCYVTGSFWDTIQFGLITLVNTANAGDIFIARYDTSGNPVWVKQAAGDGDDVGLGVAVDGEGFSYLSGSFNGTNVVFGTTTITNSGSFTAEIFVSKFDPAGNSLWAKSAGSTDEEVGSGIAIDKDGNGYVAGYFNTEVTFGGVTVPNVGASDALVAKFDAPPFVYEMNRISPTEMRFTYPYLPITAGMESVTALGSGSWQAVTNASTLIDEQRTVTVTTTNGSRFFRLNKSPGQ